MGIMEERQEAAENKTQEQLDQISEAKRLKGKGYTNHQAAIIMGISESTFRSLVK